MRPGATIAPVRRFALGVIAALLTISASGLVSLVMLEPCRPNESARSDSACPPTCVTCGCCDQAAESVTLVLTPSPDVLAPPIVAPWPRMPDTDPRAILHVPRARL